MAKANELSGQIQDFIERVAGYIEKGTRYARAERIACHMARQGEESHPLNAAIPEYLAQFKKSRQAVLTAAMPLAESIERADASSKNLLTLRNAVEGPGAPASLSKLWPTLKSELQQVAIHGGKKPTPPEDPEQMVSPENIAKRYGLTLRQKDRLRKRLEAWRKPSNCTEWFEVVDRKPRQPQFLYRLGAIIPMIEAGNGGG